MSDYAELKRAAEAAAQGHWNQDGFEVQNDDIEDYRVARCNRLTDAKFIAAASPAAVLALIAENERLRGPHDWLAEDLIKELVDNAQAFQENSEHGDNDPFAIVLLAAASRIRRQEAGIEKLKADVEQLAKTADCWDRLNVCNKALSDSFRAERDHLRVEIEALRKDAERYRHLRECNSGSLCVTQLTLDDGDQVLVEAEADQAIDAAIGKGEQS